MSELKYSGLVVAIGIGFLASLTLDNLYLIFVGIAVGIIYEILNK